MMHVNISEMSRDHILDLDHTQYSLQGTCIYFCAHTLRSSTRIGILHRVWFWATLSGTALHDFDTDFCTISYWTAPLHTPPPHLNCLSVISLTVGAAAVQRSAAWDTCHPQWRRRQWGGTGATRGTAHIRVPQQEQRRSGFTPCPVTIFLFVLENRGWE